MARTLSPIHPVFSQADLDAPSIQKQVRGLATPCIFSLACIPYNLSLGQKRHWDIYLVWWDTHAWNLSHHRRCLEAMLGEEPKPHSEGLCWWSSKQSFQPKSQTNGDAVSGHHLATLSLWLPSWGLRQAVPTVSFPSSCPEYHVIRWLLFYTTIRDGLSHS